MSRKSKRKIRAKATVTPIAQQVKESFNVNATSMVAKTEPLFPKKLADAPVVWYTNLAWQKMKKAIAMCTEEVGWLGTVDPVEGGYLVTDIFIPEQTVTGTETDITAEAMAALMDEIGYPENLHYWGHSHVNMGVSPSGQDESQLSEYLEHCDFFIRGIYNKKGESKVDVFDVIEGVQYQRVSNGLRVQELEEDVMKDFVATVNKNVKKRTYQGSYQSNYGRNQTQHPNGGSQVGSPVMDKHRHVGHRNNTHSNQRGASNDNEVFRYRHQQRDKDVTVKGGYVNPFITEARQ